MRVETEVAYILHKRPFRDSSQILDVFSRSHGRVSLMSKGSRGVRSKTAGLLQLFRPLLLSWQGRGEMPLISKVEVADIVAPALTGVALKSAIYLNELLVYLLHKNDVNSDVFELYHKALYQLAETRDIEVTLRLFEKALLGALGFGLNLKVDADSDQPVVAGCQYVYHFEHGPVACSNQQYSGTNPLISGESLIAYQQNQLKTSRQLTEIKRLMRYVIDAHLGYRKLKSRELFRSPLVNSK